MAYETSPKGPRVRRSVVRVVMFVGAVVAVWLIAPAAANALEPPASPEDAVTEASDAATETVTDAATSVTEASDEATETVTDTATSVTEASDEATETVTDAATSVTEASDEATETVTDAADSAGDTTREAAASVRDEADDVVSTVENAGDGAADVARPLQDAASTVDVRDTMSYVEANAESVTAPPIAPWIDGSDAMGGPGDREDVTSLRLADEQAFTSTGLTFTTGPIAAAAPSDAGAAATSSSGAARDAPATPDGVPPPAMGSTARDVLRGGSSFDDLAAILAAIMIALGLVRWSRRENETVYSPVFLSLAGHPG